MNWRRGLLLAGIHLVVAWILVGWQEAGDWSSRSSNAGPKTTATLRLTAWQEGEQAVPFDPCNGGYVCYWVTPQYQVVSVADFPAVAISGWFLPCPPPWTLAGILRRGSSNVSRSEALLVAASLCALVPLQWFLIGAFPLIRPRRWWLEPGAIITVWTVVAFVMVLIPGTRDIANFPMLVAVLGWIYWLALLVWKGFRTGWRLVMPKPAAAG
jgi:hypothetical protein